MWEQFGQVDVPSNEDLLGGGLPCYGIYKTSDGRYLAVGALEYKFWEAASRAFGHAQWADIHWQRGVMPQLPASKSLKKMVADLVASKPLAHWAEVFSEVDACVTPVLTLKEAMAHPLFENRAVLREQVEKSSKEVVSLGHPIEFSDYKVEVRQKAP